MSTLTLGNCSAIALSGSLSGLTLDSAGGVLSCAADGQYSQASSNYLSGCGDVSVSLVSTYWSTGAGKVLTVSGVRQCSSSSSSLDAEFAAAAKQLAGSTVFWGSLSIGILFAFSINALSYGIGVIRRSVESGFES